ncbi:MAG: heat-inducible transcriptional repressor HrcA [Bacillota bacterium]|nr:heat-inducible transcriptional repressor HrcA [Bacillota bacterium]
MSHEVVAVRERSRQILKAIVRDYVRSAEPVASRTIARKYLAGLSPATVRNEMADLEEAGFLEQPHTSAGRVPSDKGYRYFVDFLLDPPEEPAVSLIEEQAASLLELRARRVEALMQEAARVLAEMTECLSVVTAPQLERLRLHAVHLLPAEGGRALLILVSEEGVVDHRLVDLGSDGEPVSGGELEALSALLTRTLAGLTLREISAGLLHHLENEVGRFGSVLGALLEAMDEEESGARGLRIILHGVRSLFQQPEFRDVGMVQILLELLEQEEMLVGLLEAGAWMPEHGVSVAIGRELPLVTVRQFSMVSAPYATGGTPLGRVGVVGPRRMDYAVVMMAVDEVTRRLESALERML